MAKIAKMLKQDLKRAQENPYHLHRVIRSKDGKTQEDYWYVTRDLIVQGEYEYIEEDRVKLMGCCSDLQMLQRAATQLLEAIENQIKKGD